MELPKLQDLDVAQKKVLVRADLDFDPEDTENLRFKTLIPTLDYIKKKGGDIILIGHKGRPQGRFDENLSLKPFQKVFEKWGAHVLENLRFDPGEEANDENFAKSLAVQGDVYVNESFAASHRVHTSIVGLPKYLPHAAGLRFVAEVANFEKVLENPRHPLVIIISGFKDDKLSYIPNFMSFADRILIGGRMPDYIHDTSLLRSNEKVFIAGLVSDKEDITMNSIEKFEIEIGGAGTIVVAGPLGKFEEEGHRQGTSRVFTKIAESSAYKVAGGGDTVAAINLLGLADKFDWMSVGGGAMLTFLAKGTLPGITALLG
jgi:phosphoglycerate kinase